MPACAIALDSEYCSDGMHVLFLGRSETETCGTRWSPQHNLRGIHSYVTCSKAKHIEPIKHTWPLCAPCLYFRLHTCHASDLCIIEISGMCVTWTVTEPACWQKQLDQGSFVSTETFVTHVGDVMLLLCRDVVSHVQGIVCPSSFRHQRCLCQRRCRENISQEACKDLEES